MDGVLRYRVQAGFTIAGKKCGRIALLHWDFLLLTSSYDPDSSQQ
jgi:hypothetical protein